MSPAASAWAAWRSSPTTRPRCDLAQCEAVHALKDMLASHGRAGTSWHACEQVKLVRDAREQALIALQKDPDNDLAQHLAGRWHTEMANLNSIARTLIRLMYGADLPNVTHREAHAHYRTATRMATSGLIRRCACSPLASLI